MKLIPYLGHIYSENPALESRNIHVQLLVREEIVLVEVLGQNFLGSIRLGQRFGFFLSQEILLPKRLHYFRIEVVFLHTVLVQLIPGSLVVQEVVLAGSSKHD